MWEQPAAAPLVIGPRSDLPRAFAGVIPPAVETVRITFDAPDAEEPLSCCLAIRRGSATFAARRITLAKLPAGPATLAIAGFASDFAPADGFPTKCETIPADAAIACDAARSEPPSFASDPTGVTVVAGARSDAGDVSIPAYPFVKDLDPAPGAVVSAARVPIKAVIVDAVGDIAETSIDVRVFAGVPPAPFAVNMQPNQACDESVPAPNPPCGDGPDLDVRGVIVTGRSDPLPAGDAEIRIHAENADVPPRAVDMSYTITVVPGTTTTTFPPATITTTSLGQATTTTTTTTTTLSGGVTTTTTGVGQPTTTTTQGGGGTSTTTVGGGGTTTTTLPQGQSCKVVFSTADATVLSGLTFVVDYGQAAGGFDGAGLGVACVSRAASALATFNDDETNTELVIGLADAIGFAGPTDLAECDFTGAAPVAGDFGVAVIEAFDPTLVPQVVTVEVGSIACN